MRVKTISISSDSCIEDDMPLKTLKNNGIVEDMNCYHSLCKHSPQPCEFCDRISKNRYSSLIHNVSHIIIPLLNQTISQCPTCLHSFTSEKELRTHSLKKHPEVTLALKPQVIDVHSSPRKSQNSSLNRSTMESQTKNNERNVICIGTKKNGPESRCIKSRLVFEDDDLIYVGCTSDQLLSDLTTDCKVNIEAFDTPWLNGEQDQFSGKSVHYDELKKPGVYRCRKCSKRFPTRFDAIVHESSHIKFKNSKVSLCVICKKYLVGGKIDLRHHYLTYHRGDIDKNHQTETESLIHKLLFEENLEERKTIDSKIISLCDLCLSFCKNTSSMSYECINTVSKIGKRYVCEKCGQLFFDINLVKRSLQRRALYGTHIQKKRKKTNEDRLKTIANRFKMMKH